MALEIIDIGEPGSGLGVKNRDIILTTHGAITQGGCYSIDWSVVNATSLLFTTTKAVVTADYQPTTDLCGVGLFVIALETGTVAGQKLKFRISGYVDALVDGTTDVTIQASGTTSFLIPQNGSINLATSTALAGATTLTRAVGVSTVTRTANSAALTRILFDGQGLGFGHSVA